MDGSHPGPSVWKYTTKGKSFINTGNVLLAWIFFSTPSLFISQLSELLTYFFSEHISSVPAASPVTLVFTNCRQIRFSFPSGKERERQREKVWGGEREIRSG